jgi:hypothetical protein
VEQSAYSADDLGKTSSGLSAAVSLRIRFPQNRASGTEPLLSTGNGASGNLVSVSYLPGNRLRFNVEHDVEQPGNSRIATIPVFASPGLVHTVAIKLGSLSSRSSDDTDPDPQFALGFDGRILLSIYRPTRPSDPKQVEYGLNTAVYDPACSGMFSGTIVSEEAGPASKFGLDVGELRNKHWGPVILDIRFPVQLDAGPEPLVVTGVTGAGDLIYFIPSGPNVVRFGFDHWGVGGFVGDPVTIDPAKYYKLEVRMDSLYSAGSRPAGEWNSVSVLLDGKNVLLGRSPCHPTTVDCIQIGENRIGGSTCGPAFSGDILDVKRSENSNSSGP